jgi:spore germination cell wall hydrolase CwlJ-like protein
MGNIAAELAVVMNIMGMFDTQADPNQVLCLAQNIYHEARQETIAGQMAVAHVTMNRVNNAERYGTTVCDVVYETRIRNGREIAQFSWVTDEPTVNLDNYVERGAFELAAELATMVIHSNNSEHVYMDGAMFYYNPAKADPRWANSMWEVASIGNHLFMIDEQ